MKPRKSTRLRQSWCRGLVFFACAIACAIAVAQVGVEPEVRRSLLSPWTTLTGAWVTAPLSVNPARAQLPKPMGFLSWQLPVALAARGNFLYVADGGHRQIFRFDQMQQSLSTFASLSAGTATSIAVARDLSLYVTDSNARQVLRFAFDGRLLQKFGNDLEMTNPVAVLLDESGGRVLVADGMYSHVLVFNSLGRLLQVLRSSQARSIVAMAQGPDGLYLVDQLERQVVVIGADGADRYTLGQGTLKMPGAIAVDRFNRVFVSDNFDNSIKVFERGELVASVGTSGAVPASFNRITSLYLEQNTLYVADSLNRRVLSFHVAPASPAAPARAQGEGK